MASEVPPLSQLAEQLERTVRQGEDIPTPLLENLLRELLPTLQGSREFRHFDDGELVGSAWEAVRAFARAVERGQTFADQHANPAGYLVRTAQNRLRDETRREVRRASAESPLPLGDETELDRPRTGDDAIASWLSASASAAEVVQALRMARARGDRRSIEVVSVWLKLAEELGTSPPLKVVADALGMTGPGVQHVLRRFSRYFRSHPLETLGE